MPTKNKRFKNLSIKTQFIAMFALACIMVVLSVMTVFLFTRKVLIENASNYANLTIDKFNNDMSTERLQLNVIGNQFRSEQCYLDLLSAEDISSIPLKDIKDIQSKLSYINSLHSDICDIAFVNDKLHWSGIYSVEDLTLLYEKASSKKKEPNGFIGIYKSSFPYLSDVTSCVFAYSIYEKGSTFGYALISIDLSKLNIAYSEDDSSGIFYLLDGNNELYPLTASQRYELEDIEDYIEQNKGSLLSYETYFENRNGFIIRMSPFEAEDCYLISLVPIGTINENMQGIWLQNSLIIGIIVTLILLIMIILYVNVIVPLNDFSNKLADIKRNNRRHLIGDLEVDGCAEVIRLKDEFTDMFNTIDKLNVQIYETSSKLYEEKIKAQTAEISFFRSQINPHFLYNVLNLIRSYADAKDVPEISTIAVAMGKMFRYNTKGSPIVPFSEELEVTKAYIAIQTMRFKNKFEVYYNISDEALSIPVIKIILQPFVENSVTHGIEPKLGPGVLFISANVTDNRLVVEIRDDGVGIPEEKLKDIQARLKDKTYNTSEAVGLVNTNARIKLQYGDEYGVTITSVQNDGTTVTLTLPVSAGSSRDGLSEQSTQEP